MTIKFHHKSQLNDHFNWLFILLDNIHIQSELYASWAKKTTFSRDYLLANSILSVGELLQIIDSQGFERRLSPFHHLPSGSVAYFYYTTRVYIRKEFLGLFRIKIIFLRLCKSREIEHSSSSNQLTEKEDM